LHLARPASAATVAGLPFVVHSVGRDTQTGKVLGDNLSLYDAVLVRIEGVR
jgi:hypothetical protein